MKDSNTANAWRFEGNKAFKAKDYCNALNMYNKSICYSTSSEQLALGYGNRSAVYLALNLFNECISNIRLAKTHNHPDSAKLQAREQKCNELSMKYCEDPEDDPLSFFKLTYPVHEKIPSIVNCLELREDETFGRCIITNQDLNPGDIIAIEEPFFKGIVSTNTRYQRCTNCLKSKMLSLIPCNTCTKAMFCDETCLIEAQEKFHFAECSSFVLGEDTDLLLNCHYSYCFRTILHSFLIAPPNYTLKPPESKVSIFDYDLSQLESPEDMSRDKLEIFNSLEAGNDLIESKRDIDMSLYVVKCFQKIGMIDLLTEDLLQDYARRLLRIINLNNVIFCDDYNLMGILLFGSLFNHSCDPNVEYFSKDNQIVFIVTKPIAKDNQLFINYILTFDRNLNDRDERRETLKVYQFECRCSACTNDLKMSDMPVTDPNFKASFGSRKYPKSPKEAIAIFKQNCSYIKDNFHLYPSLEICVLQRQNSAICCMLSTLIHCKSLISFDEIMKESENIPVEGPYAQMWSE